MTTVPFGKYKGKPVEDMLADAGYMTWLEAQPWFRERFSHLRRGDAAELSHTPEHNRLQALFLSPRYQAAFFTVAEPDMAHNIVAKGSASVEGSVVDILTFCGACENKINESRESIANPPEQKPWWHEDALKNQLDEHATRITKQEELLIKWMALSMTFDPQLKVYYSATFEDRGADVRLAVKSRWRVVTKDYPEPSIRITGDDLQLSIEIKPVVADDYPAVLRQMNRNGSTYLFLAEYTGEGATFAQVCAIFVASGKKVIRKATVDAEDFALGLTDDK